MIALGLLYCFLIFNRFYKKQYKTKFNTVLVCLSTLTDYPTHNQSVTFRHIIVLLGFFLLCPNSTAPTNFKQALSVYNSLFTQKFNICEACNEFLNFFIQKISLIQQSITPPIHPPSICLVIKLNRSTFIALMNPVS